MATKIETSRSIIRISRDGEIEESSQVAIRILDLYTHVPGQIVMIRYYIDSNRSAIDNMLAVGLKNGVGPDCYQIITPFNKSIIWGIATSMSEVDVAQFPTGRERYIYIDPETNKASYVTRDEEGKRQIQPITDGPRAYEDISTGRTIYLDTYGTYTGGGDGGFDPEEIREIVNAIIDSKIANNNTNYYNKGQIDGFLDGKVDKQQGANNAGKYLTVGVDGNVQVSNFELNWVES